MQVKVQIIINTHLDIVGTQSDPVTIPVYVPIPEPELQDLTARNFPFKYCNVIHSSVWKLFGHPLSCSFSDQSNVVPVPVKK